LFIAGELHFTPCQ